MDKIRVVASQYWIRPIASWEEFAGQVENTVRTSADYGASLVLFPEYFTTQLLSLGDPRRPIVEQVHGLTLFLDPLLELFTRLSRKYKIHIVAGSTPATSDGSRKVVNESHVFAPNGRHGKQGKLHTTRFESENWKISPSSKLQVFETDFGKIAVMICYDVEFPEIVRAAARAGAQIICVPSCTDHRQGWLRVRYCAQARTIENQVYVLHAATVGGLPHIPSVHLNYGSSAILTPSDYAFSRDGLLAEGTPNTETLVVGDLSLKALADSRKNGSVIPLHDSARSSKLAQSVKALRL